MLRWVILAVALVVLTAIATLGVQYLPEPETTPKVAVNTRTGPQPKLELDQEPIYEFGKMSQHSTDKHTWQVKNVGEANLELWMEGKPTCSCTIAALENGQKAVVKPGESTTIKLEWNTKEFHDDYSQGATFGTNDPSRPAFKLTVAGKVYPAVVVFPPQMIQFQTISNEESHQAKIAVVSPDRPKTKLTKLVTSRPGVIVAHADPLNAEEAKQLKAEAGYKVIVEIKPGMPVGQFQEELVMETDHPNQPEVKVVIGGKVLGPISAVPAGVRMLNVAGLKGDSRVITLLVRGDRDPHFRIEKQPEKLKLDIKRDDTSTLKGRYLLTVTVPAGTPAGPVDGDIVLKTDDPRASELKIPVHILVSHSGAG